MLSEKMLKALNEQINAELGASYIYLSMSAYFASINLPGFTSWMYLQSREEETHAMKIFNYINGRGGRVTLMPLAKPMHEWKNPKEVFKTALAHEQKVTGMINNLVEMALKEKDYATNNMLQWFVAEQVEEEENAAKILEDIKFLEGSNSAIYLLDKQLATRGQSKN